MALSALRRARNAIVELVSGAAAAWRLRCAHVRTDDIAQRISVQQFKSLMGDEPQPTPRLVVAVALSIVMGVLALWLTCSATFALVWGAFACTWYVTLIRLTHRFRAARPRDDQLGPWEARMRWLNVSAGCLYGSLGLLAPETAAAHAPYLALGELLVIGPALSAAIHRPAIFWLPVPCSALTTLGMVLSGDMLNIFIGLGFMVLAVLLMRRACTNHELITQSMRVAEERLLLLREHEAQRAAVVAEHRDMIRFLSSVSEDLDAPMRLIDSLSRHLSGEPAAAGEQMRHMNRAVLEMDRLLTSLLDASTKGLGRQVAPEAVLAPALTLEDAESLSGQLVLLVDDEPLALHGMQTLLQGLGCEVMCAPSAEAALRLVDEQLRTPDLMISDYRLGGEKTGLDAIGDVRELIGEAIPAWLISADLNLPAEQARPRGIQVLPKPVRGEVLAAEMKRAAMGSPAAAMTGAG